MSLQECKDYIAKEEKYYSWNDLLKNHNVKFIEALFDRVSELHTNKKTEALEKDYQDKIQSLQVDKDRLQEALKFTIDKMTEVENDTAWHGTGMHNWCVRIKENLLKALNP
jgi:predicted nuclease with TOPRIM domain